MEIKLSTSATLVMQYDHSILMAGEPTELMIASGQIGSGWKPTASKYFSWPPLTTTRDKEGPQTHSTP